MATTEHPRKPGVIVDVAGSSKLHHPPGAGKEIIEWMLSLNMAVCVLTLGWAFSIHNAYSTVIILMLASTAWMLFQIIYTRKDHCFTFDHHAGPLWLRVGFVLFGIVSLLMDVFKVVGCAGYFHCESAVKIAFPVVQSVFIVVQMSFFMRRAKDRARIQTCLTRFALMFVLATNLVVWMLAVSEESVHYAVAQDSSDAHTRSMKYTVPKPTMSEYSLFAAAMAFIMWSNVGRKVDPHHQHHAHTLVIKDAFVGIVKNAGLGSVLGATLFAAGLVTCIKYEADVGTGLQDRVDQGLMMHLVMNIVIVTTMSMSIVAGCVAYALDPQGHATDQVPSHNMDVAVLMGAALGPKLTCIHTITHTLDELNLALAILTLTQLVLQNVFLAEGLHRGPVQARTWTRRLLKEVCVYLLLGNAILCIQHRFGARPQFDQTSEVNVYGATMWTVLVNAGPPLEIFYRMFSVECLFEVFLNS